MPTELEPKTAAERDEGRILLDVESVRKWAEVRRLHVVSEALPSGEFMQLSVLHPRLYEVVHRMFSAGADKSERAADQCDKAAAAVIADDSERFKGFHPLQLEHDPRYVVAERTAREYVSDIEAAIHAGELIAHDATGRPIDLPDLLTANRKTTSQPAALARAEATAYATTADICRAFPYPKSVNPERWTSGRYLADCPKWLKSARESAGKRGVSALWSPAQFALCMVSEGHIGKGQAKAIIYKEFSPEWLDKWARISEFLP